MKQQDEIDDRRTAIKKLQNTLCTEKQRFLFFFWTEDRSTQEKTRLVSFNISSNRRFAK